MALETKDRLQKLRGQTALNGIDFVQVVTVGTGSHRRTELHIHFINREPQLRARIDGVTVTREGSSVTLPISFEPTEWGADSEGRPVLRLRITPPGDAAQYTLALVSSLLDPFFAAASFSFVAGTPVDTDCAPSPPVCPPMEGDLPPIEYLAKDFLSFRQALTDFSALRYPEWVERSEADFGVMFMEALCGLADDLSYMQDRISAEAYLSTCTQRRSLVRLARLLDYEPGPATIARVVLQFDIVGGMDGMLPAGLGVSARSPDGTTVNFEVGTGLSDTSTYKVRSLWSRGQIQPYILDQSQAWLKAGANQMWVQGHGFDFTPGQSLMIETGDGVSADIPFRQTVILVSAEETTDLLYDNAPITHIIWRTEDALTQDCDLTWTIVIGNLTPGTQGTRYTDTFVIGGPLADLPQVPVAVWRTGANGSDQYLYTLQNQPLAWLMPQDGSDGLPLPEIQLVQCQTTQQGGLVAQGSWDWLRRLLAAQPFQNAFTLDPAVYRAVTTSGPAPAVVQDYDGDAGDTIRFGDDVFGMIPDSGTLFQVSYRAGGGAVGNVAIDAINTWDRQNPAAACIQAVTNPFVAAGGADEEPAEHVQRLAPQAFQNTQLRDVLPQDYELTAETLPWVASAATQMRWTGSWFSMVTTAQPQTGRYAPTPDPVQLVQLLNRYRLAGVESDVRIAGDSTTPYTSSAVSGEDQP